MIVLNRSLNDYEHLQDEFELLQMELSATNSLLRLYDAEVGIMDSVMRMQDQKLDIMTKDYESKLSYENSLLKEYKRKSRKTTIGVGVGGTLCGFIIGVLLNR